MFRLLIISLLLLLTACGDAAHPSAPEEPKTEMRAGVPMPNTVVASDSVHIREAMYEVDYGVEVIATPETDKGVYEVLVRYGHNDASTQVTMPEADAPVIPELRRGTDPHTFIIGFRYGSDTSFKEYFLINAGRGKTVMKYLKAYSLK